jgi:uncharacterized protein YggE
MQIVEKRIVAVAMLVSIALAWPVRAQVAAAQPPAIVTNAEAHSDVQADRATILVSVETHAPTAAAAGQDNARRTKSTLDTLRAMGLTREQLGTFGYTVQPEYTRQVVSGYVARNTVRVDIRKVDDVGRLIDAALAGGATSIGSLQFMASNADSARRDALARATVQAKADAEALARAAGGTLGSLLELTGTGDSGPRPVMYAARGMAGAVATPTPIDAGPITISVSVNARWQFVPANR